MRIIRMQWKNAHFFALVATAVLGLATTADGKPNDATKGHERGDRDHHMAHVADHDDNADHPDASDHPGEHGDRDVDHPNPGQHRGWDKETTEQHATRIEARHHLQRQIWGAVHKDGKGATDEERALIKAQWRRKARLWKIRELAETDKDADVVKKCDELLSKSDDWLVKKLGELNARAATEKGGAQ